MAYLGKGDTGRARENFEKALALRPDLVSAAVRLAQLDIGLNDLEAAKGRYTAILEQDSNSIPAMIGIAEIAKLEGNEQGYVDWLQRAAATNPSALTPRLMLARYYADRKDLTRASAMAREAVEGRPGSAQAWALLGGLQMQARRIDGARTSYERLVAVAPGSAAAHYRLATAELALGNDGAARDALSASLALAPQREEVLRALYDLEKREGSEAEAGRIAEQLRTLGIDAATGEAAEDTMRIGISGVAGMPEEEVKRSVAAVRPSLVAMKRHKEKLGADEQAADAALLDWLAEHPDDRMARTYLAGSYLQRRREAAAIEQYELVLKQAPDDLAVLNNLAVLYQRNGDSRAIELGRRVYGFAPDNPNYADTLGWILVQQGDTTEGLELLEQAVRGAPDAAEIRLHLAEALLMTGYAGRARAELDRVGGLKPPPALEAKRQQLLDGLGRASAGPKG